MEKTQQNYDLLYESLYDPEESGVVVMRGIIHKALLSGISRELNDNKRNFVRRPLYYGKTLQMLSSWDFERGVLKNYDYLVALDDRYAEVSRELHSRMSYSSRVDEIRVNSSRYTAGSIGIGPHIDNMFSVNFTLIFVISGNSSFCTASNKDGDCEISYGVVPGDCVVLRGPRRVEDRNLRPIHYVREVGEERFIVTFREINHDYLHQTSRNNQYNA